MSLLEAIMLQDGSVVEEATSKCTATGEHTPFCNHRVTAKVGEHMLTAWLPRELNEELYGSLFGPTNTGEFDYREVVVTKIVEAAAEGEYRVYFDFVNDDIPSPVYGTSICWLNPLE